MKLKNYLCFLLTIIWIFSLTGCGKTQSENPPESSLPSNVSSEPVLSEPSKETSHVSDKSETKTTLPEEFNDKGIFSAYYEKAYEKMQHMNLEEKIGQMIYARCPITNGAEIAQKYHLGGYVLFGENFADKSKEEVLSEMQSYIDSQEIPMTLSVDEEGGTVTRISGKPQLSSKEFESPRDLYNKGGMELICSDAKEKAKFLKKYLIDTNLAPVCDISLDENAFMYDRSVGLDPNGTSTFVKNVTEISQKNGVSVTLKHFPGYADNADTHTGIAVDDRSLEEFQKNDFKPFEAGIQAGAHLILVSHNIVNCMDNTQPASLSPKVHQILRSSLHFTGIIITDDLDMDAVKEYSGEYSPSVAAVLAGNDMILTSDIESSCHDIKNAVEKKIIDETTINQSVTRILAWKYTTKLMQ